MNNLAAVAVTLTGGTAVSRTDSLSDQHGTASGRIANAIALSRSGRATLAETVIREAIAIYQSVFPPGHRVLAAAHSALGESLLAQGKVQQAEPLLLSSARQLGNTLHYERRLALRRLIRLYELKDDRVTARHFEEELAALEQRVQSR